MLFSLKTNQIEHLNNAAIYISIYLSIYLSIIFLSINLSIDRSMHQFLFIYLSGYQSVCLSKPYKTQALTLASCVGGVEKGEGGEGGGEDWPLSGINWNVNFLHKNKLDSWNRLNYKRPSSNQRGPRRQAKKRFKN